MVSLTIYDNVIAEVHLVMSERHHIALFQRLTHGFYLTMSPSGSDTIHYDSDTEMRAESGESSAHKQTPTCGNVIMPLPPWVSEHKMNMVSVT